MLKFLSDISKQILIKRLIKLQLYFLLVDVDLIVLRLDFQITNE